MVQIYALDISSLEMNAQYNRLLSCVSADQRKRIEQFHFAEDKKRTLYGDVLSRCVIGDLRHMPMGSIEFVKNKFGKPFASGFPPVYFNISHSGDWVICAVGEREVGVDVEEIKPIDLGIARRFYTPNESRLVLSGCEEERLKTFYLLWTLKESYTKYVGKGLSIPLNSFEIVNTERGYSIAGLEDEIAMWSAGMSDRYIISICHLAAEPMSGIQILDARALEKAAFFGGRQILRGQSPMPPMPIHMERIAA